jgi:hypothetical protein
VIISGALCRNILPLIHDVAQLHSIFILCENKTEHDQSAKDWPKIKGIFTEISPICEVLKQAAQQCEQNVIPISFIKTSADVSKKNLDQLEPSFMYTTNPERNILVNQIRTKTYQRIYRSLSRTVCWKQTLDKYQYSKYK